MSEGKGWAVVLSWGRLRPSGTGRHIASGRGDFFPVRCRSVSCGVTLEGGEMDCNRNNLSVISASRGCRLQTFFFFFFFFSATQSPAGTESTRTSAGSEHRTQMPSVCWLKADWVGQWGREAALGRRVAHQGWTVTLRRIFKSNLREGSEGRERAALPIFQSHECAAAAMSWTNCSPWKTSSRQFRNIFLSLDVRSPNWVDAMALTRIWNVNVTCACWPWKTFTTICCHWMEMDE